jgi:molybdopterin-binding protein
MFICLIVVLVVLYPSSRLVKQLKISARNALKGTITSITKGPVNSEVVIDIGGGVLVTAMITAHAVENLSLKEGMSAYAVIKASEVMVAVE